MFGSSSALLTDNMSRILNVAGMAAVGMTAASMLLLAEPGFASDLAADANLPTILLPGADAPVVAEKANLSTSADAPVEDHTKLAEDTANQPQHIGHASRRQRVWQHVQIPPSAGVSNKILLI